MFRGVRISVVKWVLCFSFISPISVHTLNKEYEVGGGRKLVKWITYSNYMFYAEYFTENIVADCLTCGISMIYHGLHALKLLRVSVLKPVLPSTPASLYVPFSSEAWV